MRRERARGEGGRDKLTMACGTASLVYAFRKLQLACFLDLRATPLVNSSARGCQGLVSGCEAGFLLPRARDNEKVPMTPFESGVGFDRN